MTKPLLIGVCIALLAVLGVSGCMESNQRPSEVRTRGQNPPEKEQPEEQSRANNSHYSPSPQNEAEADTSNAQNRAGGNQQHP